MINRRRRNSFFRKQNSFYSSQIEAVGSRLRWWQQLLIVMLFLVFIVAVWYVFFSNIFTVTVVSVENNVELSEKEILEDVDIEGKNIFLIETSEIVSKMKSNNEIYDVRLVRVLPNIVRIIVTEHKPVLVWQSENRKFYVNQSGIAYKKTNGEVKSDIYRVVDVAALDVQVGEPVVPRSFLRSFMIMQEKLSEIYEGRIDFFEVEETVYDLDLILNNGTRVRFNILSDVANQIEELKKISQLRPDLFDRTFIDLRVDRWAYIR